jgi:hypothetical protein
MSVPLLLEGGADRVCAGCSVAGTYCDLTCVTVRFTVVINAILNIAPDPLDMLAAILFI